MSAPRFTGSFLATVFLAAFVSIAPATAKEIDAAEYWTVAEVSGAVTARIGGNPWNATEQIVAGQQVGPFSTIEAGRDGEAIFVRGGDRMTLYANTEIELPPVDRSSGITRIFQRAGEVLFRVRKRPSRGFEVETPYLVAGVRGTTFGVTATDATSELHVVEGAVAVGSSDDPERQTIVNALERATAGLGLEPAYQFASEPTVEAWDDRSMHQAELLDALALNGPVEVRQALVLTPLPAVAATGLPARPVLTETQDLAARLVDREQFAVQRAAQEPTQQNRAAASLAKISNLRLASAGLVLDAAPSVSRQNSQAATPAALPMPGVTVPNPVAAPVQPATRAPAVTLPGVVQPQAAAPRSLLAPSTTIVPTTAVTVVTPPSSPAASASGSPSQSAAEQAPVIPPDTDGVVYTTYGILPDQAVVDGASTPSTVVLPEELNIEGLGAGN